MQGNLVITERKRAARFRYLLMLVALLFSVSTFSWATAQSYAMTGANAGSAVGDVIEQVNQRPAMTSAELKAALDRAGSRPVLLLVNRHGTSIFTVKVS